MYFASGYYSNCIINNLGCTIFLLLQLNTTILTQRVKIQKRHCVWFENIRLKNKCVLSKWQFKGILEAKSLLFITICVFINAHTFF